jgi:hypothetical protein
MAAKTKQLLRFMRLLSRAGAEIIRQDLRVFREGAREEGCFFNYHRGGYVQDASYLPHK